MKSRGSLRATVEESEAQVGTHDDPNWNDLLHTAETDNLTKWLERLANGDVVLNVVGGAYVRALLSTGVVVRQDHYLVVGNPYYRDRVATIWRTSATKVEIGQERAERLAEIRRQRSSAIEPPQAVEGPMNVRQVQDEISGPEPAYDQIPVDIALVTVIKEEYAAVLRHLPSYQHEPGTADFPNMHAWVHAMIKAPARSTPFHVVLGLAARAGSDAGGLAVINTIERFDPAYLMLVGIAGGLRDVKRGDAVVSDVICGYEYGKIDGGYQPRPDRTLPVDGALLAAASVLPVQHPDWHSKIVTPPPQPTTPSVVIGSVASGDKVVDDVSDPYFLQVRRMWTKLVAVEMEGIAGLSAINNARDKGRRVGFIMIRGISDLPRDADSVVVGAKSHSATSQTIERDTWKTYAAETAGVLALQLVVHGWPRPPRVV